MWRFLLRLVVSIVLSGIAAFLSYRKPPTPDAGTLAEFGNPKAEEGSEIKKIFGTVTIKDPQVAWFGDLASEAIIVLGPRKYGLFGPKSKTTVGYKYSLGIHFVPCLGAIDTLNRISIDNRIGFIGSSKSGIVQICKPNLFGASDREGGITGILDVMSGEPTQGQNSYLNSVTPAPHPAYRGVMSVVLRQGYIGNSPNLRPWSFRVSRINNVDADYNDGIQWLPEYAAIYQRTVSSEGEPQSIHIAVDNSGSMDWIASNGLPRMTNAKTALVSLLNTLEADINSSYVIRIITWSTNVNSSLTSSDFTALRAFVNAMTVGGATEYGPAFSDAETFFATQELCNVRRMLFVTDEGTSASLAAAVTIYQNFDNVGVLGISIDNAVTNHLRSVTDNAIRVDAGNPVELEQGVLQLFAEFDINPIHILREVLLSPDTGGSGISADAGSTWTAAAITLYNEEFGLSMSWSNTRDRGEFKSDIERHIDGRSYIDRRTGLWEVTLIRDDFDPDTIPVFDASNVTSWVNINFPEEYSLLNQLVVVYNDPEKDEPTSLTISNPPRIRMNGSRVIQEKVEYAGVQNSALASRIAQRDLTVRSAGLITGEFVTTFLPIELNLGSPIKINNPSIGLTNKIVRIIEIEDGNILESATRVKFIEDRFSLGEFADIEVESPPVVTVFPEPVFPRFAEEIPRYLAISQLGIPSFDEAVAYDADIGFLHVAGASPSSISQSAILQVNEGSGYTEIDTVIFSYGATILSLLSIRADRTIVVVQSINNLTLLPVNSFAKIGNEHVIITAIVAGDTSIFSNYWFPTVTPTKPVYTLTLKRAVFDTSPEFHASGSGIVFYKDIGLFDDDPYTETTNLDVKLQTVTTNGVLNISVAPIDNVDFDSRILRPYPPAQVRVDNSYEDLEYVVDTVFAITWSHRNRLNNDLLSHIENGPGSPETGVTYNVRAWVVEANGDLILPAEIDTNVGSLLTYSLDTTGMTVSSSQRLRVVVTSERSTLESLFNRTFDMFPPLPAPSGLTAGVVM